MLDNLSEYELVKQKSKSLEELLRACAYMDAPSEKSEDIKFTERTFIPGNLGNVKLG
jgi:hypothetical protein